MKRHLVAATAATVVAALVLAPGVLLAQSLSPTRSVTGLGYGYGSIGAAQGSGYSDGTLNFGGGFEVIAWDALGIGADLGYLGSSGGLGDGFGVFSVNGTYHFYPGQSRRARPFVTGGYSLAFRDGHENMFNVGGGVDYWLRPGVGLRMEFRDHIWTRVDTVHFWGVRFGVVLR